MTSLGSFAWHELLTTDPKAAQTFYSKVVGWTTAPWGGDSSYTLWIANGQAVGGCMAMPAHLLAAQVPPHWGVYLGTPDLEATCAKATGLGARVLDGPEEVPGAGRFAILEDPQGAVFGVYTGATPTPESAGAPRVGEFSWHELATSDPAAAWAFYGALFGWTKAGDFDMGPDGVYQLFAAGGAPLGGIYRRQAHVPKSNWLPYVKMKSADQAAADIKGFGGSVLVGPLEVPGGDRIVMAVDPLGAVFAVHAVKVG